MVVACEKLAQRKHEPFITSTKSHSKTFIEEKFPSWLFRNQSSARPVTDVEEKKVPFELAQAAKVRV